MNKWAMLMKMEIKSREAFYEVKSGKKASGWKLQISLRLVAMNSTSD